MVAVIDEPRRGPRADDGHVERGGDDLGLERRAHRPARDLAAAGVEDEGEIEEAFARRDVRDIGDPQLVWGLRAEVAVDQIGRGGGRLVADGGAVQTAPRDALHGLRADGGRDCRPRRGAWCVARRRARDDRDERAWLHAYAGAHRLRGVRRDSLCRGQRDPRRSEHRPADASVAGRRDAGTLGHTRRPPGHRTRARVPRRGL